MFAAGVDSLAVDRRSGEVLAIAHGRRRSAATPPSPPLTAPPPNRNVHSFPCPFLEHRHAQSPRSPAVRRRPRLRRRRRRAGHQGDASASPAGPASRRSRSPRRPASSRRTASTSTSRRSRKRTAIWPSRRATSSARPPRSRPGSCGTPTAWRPRRSSSSTRATAPTAWRCATTSQKIADLKGKTVAASSPGTAPYFTLAWFLKKNGLSVKDVTVVNLEPGPAAQAFVAGQNDAAMTYEPYLSTVRAAPQAGKIIATTLDYPMIMDTFGCTPKFLADNPEGREGAGRQLLRGGRHDREGARRRASRSWAPT